MSYGPYSDPAEPQGVGPHDAVPDGGYLPTGPRPYGGQVPFGAGQGPPPPPPTSTNGWCIASLACALASWVALYGIGGLAAVITGVIGYRETSRSGQSGKGVAVAGLIIGGLNLATVIIFVIAVVGFIAINADVPNQP